MPLTDTTIRTTNPSKKPLKLFDGGGLFLLVMPAGGKWWRFRYRFGGKEKSLSAGVYPHVGLPDTTTRPDNCSKAAARSRDARSLARHPVCRADRSRL